MVLCLFSLEIAAFATEQVDQNNLPEWAGGWTNINPTPDGLASMWQTFTPGRPSITAVEIAILTITPGRGDDTLTVEIAKDGRILTSADRHVEDGFDGLLRFEFAEAVAVVPGELYELKVHDTGLTRFGWKYASNTYDAGSRYVSASERPGTDWFFRTYAAVEPRIMYVDDDAAGANDGSSWEDAYVHLQDALADANSVEKPVEIRVAQGIYRPDQGANQILGDREATFKLINGITLKGGFASLIKPDPNARDIDEYETILSGDLAGNDIDINDPCDFQNQSTREENSYHVVTGSNTDATATLDGFTIANGNAEPPTIYAGSTPPQSMGGGMYIVSGSPTVANCTFAKNLAGEGGGMYNQGGGPKLTDCIFRSNLADMESEVAGDITISWCGHGGGMYNIGSSPTLINCTFTSNCAEAFGGGMRNKYKSSPTLRNCEFIRNTAESGGGMENNQSASTLTYCSFSQNRAGQRGGGMDNSRSTPTLTNCSFSQNLAGLGGGGMSNYSSSLELVNCNFTNNQAYDHGGGMYNWEAEVVLNNCIFSGNTATWIGGGVHRGGGAIYNNGSSDAKLFNCTFTGNSGEKANAYACNYYLNPNSLQLINCILWDGGTEIAYQDGSTIIISYTNVQGSWPGEGNIDTDPEFVQMGYWTQPSPRNPNSSVWIEGDYHLKSEAGRWDPVSESWITGNVTSACIDAGDPNSLVGDEPDPNGGRINMGAYGGTSEASKSPGYSWFFETTQGPVLAEGLGIVLPHEHIFTDLRGPTTPGYGQADAADVVRVMSPLLADAREKGVGVFIECSSIGVGRNVAVINQVAVASGLPVVVPTGVYGRANFAPPEHQSMTEDELATLFVSEIRDGIESTGIKAGFIKIATDEGPMNTLLDKILRAAGRAASETGAAIASHTPTGSNAVRQVDILESINPAIRFIWVHAQNESNRNIHVQLAARGAYIEFDSLGWNPGEDSTYISAIKNLLAADYGDHILLSHDAGWYQPGSANGGTQKPFTYLIDTFIPKLRDAGVDDATIRMITQTNPVRAFGFKSGE